MDDLKRTSACRVGVALSGGGARGLAHIGVLKILEQGGVPIDCLAGTSMGGLIAAAYAAGLSTDFMEQEAVRMGSVRRLLTLAEPPLPRRGLFEGQKVREYLKGHLGERTFDDLRMPLALIAVDLNGGQEVVLHEGRVVDAVRATIALPGILAPVEREGQTLVDGGVLNNLPADVVRRMGAELVIAVDVASDGGAPSLVVETLRHRRYVPGGLVGTLDVVSRALVVMMKEIQRHRLAQAHPDIVIRPPIPPGVTVLTGFPRAVEIVAAGEQAARESLPRVQALLQEMEDAERVAREATGNDTLARP